MIGFGRSQALTLYSRTFRSITVGKLSNDWLKCRCLNLTISAIKSDVANSTFVKF